MSPAADSPAGDSPAADSPAAEILERELPRPPRMGGLFARAALAKLPVAGRLLNGVVGDGSADGAPGETLTLSDVAVDRDRLADYDRVCGFDLSDTLPATYPHMLAFPLQLALMTGPGFPVDAIGLVHIANEIVVHRTLHVGEALTLRVWATELRPHPRGRQFDLRSEARVGSELVWEEISTNLARGRGEDTATPPAAPPDSSGLPETAVWRLPGDLGRRYGKVSGDVNPIHVHSWSAKLFGFPRAIAHGMWTAARSLAQLGPEATEPLTMRVAFKRPILLPGRVRFVEERTEAGIAFGVRSARSDSVHLDGLLVPGRS